MDFRLSQERRLVMTFALSQSLEILQMPQIELAAWLREEIEKNPLLELQALERRPPPQLPFAEVAATESLSDLLAKQIGQTFSLEKDRSIAKKLIDGLDERGFFVGSLGELSTFYRVSAEKIEQVLSVVQTFDPPGIAARDLRECLLIQLQRQGLDNSLTFRIVQEGFDDLLHGRYHALKKKLQLADFSDAIEKLARLTLRPASSFSQDPVPLAHADLSVVQIDGKWEIETMEDTLPQFRFRADYLKLPTSNSEEKKTLRSHAVSAKWLIRSLSRRRKLLCDLGRLIVKKQAAFFDHKEPLTPLPTKELAEELQVHESTLSRALSGKFISTPRGLMPIKALLSTDPAKETLARLIAQEDKTTPWTDAELALKLTEAGHPTMRRTIAKYRTQLKLGSASQRKLRHINK